MGALVDVRKRESVVITSYLRRDRWLPNGSRMVLMSVVTPTLSHSELYRSTAIDVRYFSESTEILIGYMCTSEIFASVANTSCSRFQ